MKNGSMKIRNNKINNKDLAVIIAAISYYLENKKIKITKIAPRENSRSKYSEVISKIG